MISFLEFEKLSGGSRVVFKGDATISVLLVDSRKLTHSEGVLFFAIAGERHDGHQYLSDLYRRGVRQFVVERPVDASAFPEANIVLVPSSIAALQKLAAHHRSKFNIPVVGITGSNGKTIIKEWLYQMLSGDITVVKNPGSYNSQIGVPLSVWQLETYHALAIFEAGISKPGEMEKLAAVIQPTIGIFSTIGSAHDEGFADRHEKIIEKLELFDQVACLVYCKDHTAIDEAVASRSLRTLSWGFSDTADVRVTKHRDFKLAYQGNDFTLDLPFRDPASVENALHCATVLLWLGYDAHYIQKAVAGLRSIPMRLELKAGMNACQVIDDTYNNDLGGLAISLQFLSHQHQKQKKTLILSDILESGLSQEALAAAIAGMVRESGVQRFIGIGPVLQEQKGLFRQDSLFFASTYDFLRDFDIDQFYDEAILVKGARNFHFEKIISRLEQKVHGTVMEIDLGALVHNLNYFKSVLQPDTKLMVMVKAFAYGSGSVEVANLLAYHRADYLGVAYADEGVSLRKNNAALPIMVMNPTEESFDLLLKYDLEPEIYSFKIFDALLRHLKGRKIKVHVKLDTGMHRLGFGTDDLEKLIALLVQNDNIQVASVFSHLAGADEPLHDQFSRDQADAFKRDADRIAVRIGYRPLYHILNSPGILRLREYQFDMVRLGIGLYGVDPTADGAYPLKPVATLKTIISQIRHVPAGETVGYGRKGRVETDMTVATIAIGYADGFSRAFSRGAGVVMVQGKRAPVIGNVCMDMTMIDITGIDAKEGDAVIVFGKELPIQEVAARINTIPYEILTNTSERVKRVFIAEGI
ncbi:MAG TPA: bifunctional UDP-N-acetylmuramoyl-tripeptide:D-alanyl-D-alanine ligase/alanine racemase [Ohtaekwangia sp.]|nr:bifunctional UDP-N-acetylmuramoyl-tripeptide:D-alanyl-D-alanine ligase/alanine racemase [Ohtaekwangia sp.]